MKQYNYTYSGMLKALVYFYEVKKNDVSKANDGIGIIPYIYNDAYNYYYTLWLAKEANKGKDISAYIPKEIEITIPPPQRDVVKRNLFQFLDKDEITDE